LLDNKKAHWAHEAQDPAKLGGASGRFGSQWLGGSAARMMEHNHSATPSEFLN
jgi:hypothetical protein